MDELIDRIREAIAAYLESADEEADAPLELVGIQRVAV